MTVIREVAVHDKTEGYSDVIILWEMSLCSKAMGFTMCWATRLGYTSGIGFCLFALIFFIANYSICFSFNDYVFENCRNNHKIRVTMAKYLG